MKDSFNRDIYYLRLSVTDLCNLRCIYCMAENGVTKRAHRDILSVEEIEEIVRAAAACGFTKVRVTGGEPLVRRGILDICSRVAATPGIRETCLTTNGVLLPKMAKDLHAAGVTRLNVSLDSLDEGTYREVTRCGALSDVLNGLEAALAAGFTAIKLNVVLMGGMNDCEIADLVHLTDRGVHVRFIELMPIGECADWNRERFLPNTAVLQTVPELMPEKTDGVALLYRLPGATGTVGLISPISSHFCPDCNRVRITSDGKLKPCLHSAQEINLRGLHAERLEAAIRTGVEQKPLRHSLQSGVSESTRSMNAIGG
jgi:cyclic pyranopterin phosphate synthase